MATIQILHHWILCHRNFNLLVLCHSNSTSLHVLWHSNFTSIDLCHSNFTWHDFQLFQLHLYSLYGQLFKFYITGFYAIKILHQWFYGTHISHQMLHKVHFYTFMGIFSHQFAILFVHFGPKSSLWMTFLYHVQQGFISVPEATYAAHSGAQVVLQLSSFSSYFLMMMLMKLLWG